MGMKYDFKKELKLRKEELYKEAEKKPNWLWPIPDKVRDCLEERALERLFNYTTEDDLNGDPGEQEEYIEFLPQVIDEHQESILLQPAGITQPVKTKKTGQEWSDWRRKLFNRRFNIVLFVVENRKLDSKQIKWQRITAEWNNSHPLDLLNHAQMARLYNRGLREDGLKLQIQAMSTLEAMRKLADPKDLKDWHDGKPHLRVIKTPHFTVTDSTTGKKEAQNER